MTSAEALTSANVAGARKRSKCLVFRQANPGFALETLGVEDIFDFNSSTESEGVSLPATCGRDVPIVDLRSGAEASCCADGREGDEEDEGERYSAIVVEAEAHHSRSATGLVVDRVAEILDLDTALPTPLGLTTNSQVFSPARKPFAGEVVLWGEGI